MTAALYDDVVTVAPARTLRVVRDVPEIHVPEPVEEPRRSDFPLFGPGGDPLIHGPAGCSAFRCATCTRRCGGWVCSRFGASRIVPLASIRPSPGSFRKNSRSGSVEPNG